MEMYDKQETFAKTFDENLLPEYLRQAQWAEFIELKKIIAEHFQQQGSAVAMLDIGVGNGRIIKHLHPITEIWEMIGSYDSIDNAQACVDATQHLIETLAIEHTVTVKLLDATRLDSLEKRYDLIISTWFTPRNLYLDDFPFDTYEHVVNRYSLATNRKFTHVFMAAYEKLNPHGELVLGSMYLDNHPTREKRESFYRHYGMHVITGAKDSFTATKELMWSQCFTPERFFRYLSVIPRRNFLFIVGYARHLLGLPLQFFEMRWGGEISCGSTTPPRWGRPSAR
jgi:Methyltransferase domain